MGVECGVWGVAVLVGRRVWSVGCGVDVGVAESGVGKGGVGVVRWASGWVVGRG